MSDIFLPVDFLTFINEHTSDHETSCGQVLSGGSGLRNLKKKTDRKTVYLFHIDCIYKTAMSWIINMSSLFKKEKTLE